LGQEWSQDADSIYIVKNDLTPPKGFREATITIETFASGEYEVSKTDIKIALERANLEVTGDREIHQADMGLWGPTVPLRATNLSPTGSLRGTPLERGSYQLFPKLRIDSIGRGIYKSNNN
jgi:hypothetical protein